jgi:hypothetical protein
VLVLAAALVFALPAHGEGVDQTCELTATRFDPDSTNVLFPDSSAQYWTARYTAVPGTRIRIDGIYPYARYTSWNVYDPALRPFAKKTDFEIQPDPGSSNPFLPGADRTTPVAQRHYTLFITFDAADEPGPNTIVVDPAQNPRGVFTLRVYGPDKGRDMTGGVGLPQVTWEPASATAGPSLASPCRELQKPSITTITDGYAQQDGPDAGPPFPGRGTPVWHKFQNLCQAGRDTFFDNDVGDRIPGDTDPCGNFGSGGFLSNIDNAYVSTPISRGFGKLLVIHAKAPTFADTYKPAKTMPSGEQLRYWSFCQNDPFSQRYIGCLRDDQVATRKGFFTIVISRPKDRPRCARNWLPWGPQPQGVVIYRHMLADPGFSGSIQQASYGSEQESMGDYFPSARYLKSSSEFRCGE